MRGEVWKEERTAGDDGERIIRKNGLTKDDKRMKNRQKVVRRSEAQNREGKGR